MNDNRQDVVAFDPNRWIQIAVEKGLEGEVVNCLSANAIAKDRYQVQFAGNPAEIERLELEMCIRNTLDTFAISEVMDGSSTGNAALTSCIHNAGRYLALAVLQGSDFDQNFDLMVDRFRLITRQYLVEFRNAGE